MPPCSSKTVYVLGAGFSADAKFPLQRDVLGQIMDLELSDFPLNHINDYLELQKQVMTFLRVAIDHSEAISRSRSLEEIFTLLDQCISDDANFGGLSSNKLKGVRESFIRLILFLLYRSAEQIPPPAREQYDKIAAYLILKRLQAGKQGDPFSIISLNWDTLLEDSIIREIRRIKAERKIDIDFCFYTTPLNRKKSIHTPSPKQKAKGIYNIKLLKLHGSSNWLRCPVSNGVFTGMGMPGSCYDLYVPPVASPLITKLPSSNEQGNPPTLEPLIITPTFIKEFELPHIQNTWHNAFVELRECTEVVFLGYSMPEADYHFRTLLRRALRPETKVSVVLTENDNLQQIPRKFRWTSATTRYASFFGEDVDFHYNRVSGYFSHCIKSAGGSSEIRKKCKASLHK